MRFHIKSAVALFVAAIALPAPAFAWDFIVQAHVNAIETTFAPDQVGFWVDGLPTTCTDGQGLGSLVHWTARGSDADKLNANGQSALATLLTARASGRTVKLYGRSTDCQIEFMYLT